MDQVYFATTNADFLNKAFHTNYKQYQKSIWYTPENVAVWMVHMDGIVRNEWKNYLYTDRIVEQYVGNNPVQLKKNKEIDLVRIVVKITDSQVTHRPLTFEILGIYEISLSESKLESYRVWRKK